MITKEIILAGCAVMVLSVGAASAGPCNTGAKDAGSRSTPGGYRPDNYHRVST